MLDFPFFFNYGEARGECMCAGERWPGEGELLICTHTGITQRELEPTGHPTVAATGFLYSSLPLQSRS